MNNYLTLVNLEANQVSFESGSKRSGERPLVSLEIKRNLLNLSQNTSEIPYEEVGFSHGRIQY